MVLIIDQGTLRVELLRIETAPIRHVRLRPASPNGAETRNLAGTQTVRHGDVLIVPGGSELQLRNYSADHASLLSIAATASQDGGPATWVRAEGIDRELLARGFSLGETDAGHAVFVGLATMPPGGVFTHQGIQGGGEFVIAADGTVATEAIDGLVWTVDSASNTTASDTRQLSPGEGAAIDSASEVRFEAVGPQPATFWIVTFVPIEQPVT